MGPQRFRRGDGLYLSAQPISCIASMGPQRFRRGDADAFRDRSARPGRFNGAAAFPPRRLGY